MPRASEIAACRWLPDRGLSLYVSEYQRTGFQGGLNGYHARLTAEHNAELQLFANGTVDVPSMFSVVRVTIKHPERSRACKTQRALKWTVFSWLRVPAIGCSTNDQ